MLSESEREAVRAERAAERGEADRDPAQPSTGSEAAAVPAPPADAAP
ncbi:MAG: hypothetical protein QOD61_2846, partial [Solirubrobacteraceae bacterium]|nr:hypothetical protein [Solirubrobacteraceae bacterium]